MIEPKQEEVMTEEMEDFVILLLVDNKWSLHQSFNEKKINFRNVKVKNLLNQEMVVVVRIDFVVVDSMFVLLMVEHLHHLMEMFQITKEPKEKKENIWKREI